MNNLQPVTSSSGTFQDQEGLLWERNIHHDTFVCMGMFQKSIFKKNKHLIVYKQLETEKLLYRCIPDYTQSDSQFFVSLWNGIPKKEFKCKKSEMIYPCLIKSLIYPN